MARNAEAENSSEVCGCISQRVRGGISKVLAYYAKFAARRPKTSLLLSLAFVVVCVPGLALLEFSADEINMYVRGALTTRAFLRHKELFSFLPELTGSFHIFAAKDGKDLLEQRTMLEIGRAIDKIMAVKTANGDGFAEVCEKSWRGQCEVDSAFHYFREAAPGLGLNFSTTPAGMGEVEGIAWHLSNFCATQPGPCNALLAPQQGFLIGSVAAVAGTSNTSGALDIDSFQVILYLNPDRKDSDGTLSCRSFQTAVMEYTHAPSYTADGDNLQTDDFYVNSFSQSVLEFESARPSENEGHLFGVAFTLTLAFVCCAIVAPPHFHSRVLLGLSCMIVVLLSLACAAGLSGYAGVPYTSMTTLAIFTLFGVSVDDIVVIVHAYDRLPGTRTAEKLDSDLEEALGVSGPAITLTSSTSLVAFGCAAFCPIPNITFFCITAAFGILSVYVLQLTFFVPLFVMDERRRLAGKRECFGSTCFGSLPLEESSDGSGTSTVSRILGLPSVHGGFGFVDKVAKVISKNHAVQAAIAVTFALMVGLGCWGVTQASSDADLTEYFIDGSFIKEFYKLNEEQYAARAPFYLVIEHQNEGLFDDARMSDINGLFDDLAALDFTFEPHEHWLKDFDAYLTSTHPTDLATERARLQGNAQAFGAKVTEFLDADAFSLPNGQEVMPWRHKRNIMFEGGVVRASRLAMGYETDFGSQERYIDNMHKSANLLYHGGARGSLDNPRIPHTFGISKIMLAANRDEQVLEIIYVNLAIACAAVAATVMLLLNPLVGLYVGALVACLDVIVIALLTLYGNKLDFVAFLCLSMTIGLVVDYSTHTAHAYMHHVGNPDDRLYNSISKMGASVLAGGGSTVLGICALGFAGSEAFRAFFRVLGTAIFIGTAVGITVGPVLLREFHGIGLLLLGSQGSQNNPKEDDTKI